MKKRNNREVRYIYILYHSILYGINMFDLIKEKAISIMANVQMNGLKNDENGYADLMKGGIVAIVAVVIIALLASALIPGSITNIIGVNTSTWDAGTVSIWDSIPIFIVLVIILIFVGLILAVF